mmetsp:Transcript_1584/g.3272  ORF Transcript_1584/g.3272 Transcript_1584/m.3272 type:complete len:1052 (+) Transcript_1584:96-3251(+)
MFSMSATAPNSARKNQRHQRRGANRDSSPGSSGSVGGGDSSAKHANTISGGDSFVSPSKVNHHLAARSQNNNSPTQQNSLGETAIQSQGLSPLPPIAPRRSLTDTKRSVQKIKPSGASNNSPDDRDEESNGQRSSAHILGNVVQNNGNKNTNDAHHVESKSPMKIDASNDSPLSKKTAGSITQRNDSLTAYIHDMDLSPNNHHPRLNVSPKQDRCSPEMKKNILSLLEKDGQQLQQQQQEEESNVNSSNTDFILDDLESLSPTQPQHPSGNDQEQHGQKSLLSNINSTLYQPELQVCRKRLETEESRASTLSGNDLLNLQHGCALSSTSSFTNDGNNSNNFDTMNEVAVNRERLFSRSRSLEPMVEDVEDEEGLAGGKGEEASITHDNNDVKSKSSPPPPPPPSSLSPLIYRLYNNSPTSPLSEVHSTLMGGASKAAALQGSPCSSTGITPSLFQENADDDIGGDTYFEGKLSPRSQPSPSSLVDNKRRDSGYDNGGGIDDFMTPLPPPRVNRTKNNPMRCSSSPSSNDHTTSSAAASSNITATSIAELSGAPSLPIQSPRRQSFTHTHSLLDDCSDEEENDDDDDEEELSSSYVMVDGQSSSRGIHSWKKRSNNQRSSGSSSSISQQMASNNIQIALLQTRHRRWEIQSAFCGAHAQSNQVFDLSNRIHHIPKFHNRHQQHFSFSPIRPSTSAADVDDDGVAFLARLSVPIESIRAGALGSGLWRTVRLVKLPQGLFGWHWLMWKEQRQEPDSVYFGDNMPLDNEVWSLLQMLGETFPNLEQIDFGGDVAKSPSREDQSVDSADTYNKEEWRNEILTCIMQCLPKLVVVDGFAVEMERVGEEDSPTKSYETQESSADGSFGDVPLNANDERQFMKPGRDGQAHTGVRTRRVRGRTSSFNIPNQCDVATETSDAIEDVSENIMSLCGPCEVSHSEEKSITNDHYGPIESIASEDETKVAQSASSPLASSFSWGSTGSSARPPPCPKSDSRRRLPNKPTIKSQMKSKLSKKNKRRLKKLTGLIPSMMDEEEDSDDDESMEGEAVEECPADLL